MSDIMLIEDNSDDVVLFKAFMRDWGNNNHILWLKDGIVALERLRDRKSALPDLILLDWHLPNLSGAEVLDAIREDRRLRSIPVIVITSYLTDSEIRNSFRSGADAYLMKPFEIAAFLRALRSVGLEWTI